MTFKEYMKDLSGYEVRTTFWEDFTIAERLGIDAIEDTYNRAFEAWRENTEYITELAIVLNHRLWMHYDADRQGLARVYDELWRACDMWCVENLKGEDYNYYIRTTD